MRRGNETECRRVSVCESETDCKNRNCKMCNCRALLGWTNAGIAGDVSGRSIPSRPRLPPFFHPWISSNLSSKGSLGETGRPRPCPTERSFESGNPVRGIRGGGYPGDGDGRLDSRDFRTDRLNRAPTAPRF